MVTERKGSKTKVAARTRAPQGPAVALLPYDDRVVGVEVRRPKRESPNAYVVETMKRVKRGEAKASAAWTLHFEDGLDLFNRLSPSAWWVRAYDLERILVSFGLGALDGIVACGLGAPSETVSVAAHIDSPRVAPMMAEAYARLAKQRAIAEKWLFDFPEAAAIGLVPLAAIGRGKACAHGRSALARLIDGGKGEIVREVAARYGLAQTDALGELLSRAPKAQSIGAVPDLDEEVRELERTLLRATPSTATYEALDRLTKVDTDRALFAVADDDRVEKRGNGLGMRGRGASGDDERIVLAAGVRAKGNAAQIEHGEDVRVGELELEREAHHVELGELPSALERHERQPARAELGLHVDPRRVTALGQRARIVVQDFVEDLEAEVAHPDVVDVWKREANA